jgi:two-component system CheB/CheR fusion protein
MVLCKDYALPYFDDHIDGLVITFYITLAKKGRGRRLNYENRYLRLFESATDGILIQCRNWKIIDVNPF